MIGDVHSARETADTFVVFAGSDRVAAGTLAEAAVGAKRALECDDGSVVLVFNAATGEVADLDLRGPEAEILARYAPVGDAAPKRGRPKLGVVAREVTLLPRHWEWLANQSGGASVALRRLVDAARKRDAEAGSSRTRVEGAYRFMSAIGGDLPGFEDATRDLFAGDWHRLRRRIQDWPADVRDHVLRHVLAKEDETKT